MPLSSESTNIGENVEKVLCISNGDINLQSTVLICSTVKICTSIAQNFYYNTEKILALVHHKARLKRLMYYSYTT